MTDKRIPGKINRVPTGVNLSGVPNKELGDLQNGVPIKGLSKQNTEPARPTQEEFRRPTQEVVRPTQEDFRRPTQEVVRPERADRRPIDERVVYSEDSFKNLEIELEKKKSEIADLNRNRARVEADYNAKIAAMQKTVDDKNREINNLTANRKDGLEEQLRATKVAIEKRLTDAEYELIVSRSTIARLQQELDMKDAHLKSYEETLESYKVELQNARDADARLSTGMMTSYTPEDISNNLNDIIDQFDERVDIKKSAVGYVVNTVDVDLKAQVFMDERGKLHFLSGKPSAGQEAYSNIKISIRAIPRDEMR